MAAPEDDTMVMSIAVVSQSTRAVEGYHLKPGIGSNSSAVVAVTIVASIVGKFWEDGEGHSSSVALMASTQDLVTALTPSTLATNFVRDRRNSIS
ncbi:hypothetical protein PIB30_004693 [Stylosanthes scabra]|uniref:Uncharacterized protein n=1 Tax=Stylosanthes scabra TaxID=79078 RepID=A0ABU6R3E2_9FABA|nr:hypothetical protein [Stylosanthes scabra]